MSSARGPCADTSASSSFVALSAFSSPRYPRPPLHLFAHSLWNRIDRVSGIHYNRCNAVSPLQRPPLRPADSLLRPDGLHPRQKHPPQKYSHNANPLPLHSRPSPTIATHPLLHPRTAPQHH